MNETGKKLIRRQKSTHDVDDVVNNYYWCGACGKRRWIQMIALTYQNPFDLVVLDVHSLSREMKS